MGQRGGQLSHHADAVQMREIRLELAHSFAPFFGALALGDIHCRPDEDKTLWIFAGQGTSYGSNVFDGAIGHQQAMLDSKLASLDRGAVNDFPQTHPVVRMSSVKHQLNGRLYRGLAFEYPISLLGPVDFPSGRVPAEAPGVA